LGPVKTGDSVNVSRFRPLSRALDLNAIASWSWRGFHDEAARANASIAIARSVLK